MTAKGLDIARWSSNREANLRMRVIARQTKAGHNNGRFSLTRSGSEHGIRADERSWRRVARSRPSRLLQVIVVATFVVVIVLTGLVQTRQHWRTMQSELETAERATDQAKAQVTEFAKRLASLNTELEAVNAERNELQTKFDQATLGSNSANSQLKEKQSQLEGMQSELDALKQVADQAKAQATEVAKRFASLSSDLVGGERPTQ